MSPSLSKSDSVNQGSGTIEEVGEDSIAFSRRTAASYFQNVRTGKDRPTRLFTSDASALSYHVGSVICRRAKPQMIGAYAGPCVARVKHGKRFRDWPIVNNPRGLMRVNGAPSTATDISVSLPRFCRLPYPAFGFWVIYRNKNLVPEAKQKGFGKSLSQQVFCIKKWLHSISLVDCLPRLRLFVQRAANFLILKPPITRKQS